MNDVNDLRDVLFETLRAVKSGEIDLDRAKAINETAQSIINTAKVEVECSKVTGAHTGGRFLDVTPSAPKPAVAHHGADAADPARVATGTGIKTVAGNVTTHRLRG